MPESPYQKDEIEKQAEQERQQQTEKDRENFLKEYEGLTVKYNLVHVPVLDFGEVQGVPTRISPKFLIVRKEEKT